MREGDFKFGREPEAIRHHSRLVRQIRAFSAGADSVGSRSNGLYVDYERRIVPWFGLDTQILRATPAIDTSGATGGTSWDKLTVWTGSFGHNFHFFGRARGDLHLGFFGSHTEFSEHVDNALVYQFGLGWRF